MKSLFKFSFGSCPHCGSAERCRTGRPRNWRLMPVGRSYSCRSCNSQFIDLYIISLLVERGFSPFYVPESELDSALHAE